MGKNVQFQTVKKAYRKNGKSRAVSLTEFDKYCSSPEPKQCHEEKKFQRERSSIRPSITKQRRTKNRFATKKDNKPVTGRTLLGNDFVELIQKKGETKALSARKKEKPVVDGKGPVEQKKRTQVKRNAIRAEPGIECNIFYLLSRYGDDVFPLNTENIDTLNTTRRKLIPWSCSRAWFLCSIRKHGYPSNIRTLGDARWILTSSSITSYESDYTVRQKILDLCMVQDFREFLDREYSVYSECKFQTLQFVGYFAMKKAMEVHKERLASEQVSYQCLEWDNNSCALDAFLFIVPQICYTVIHSRMFRSKIAGSDPCFHSPVACIFAALEAVYAEDMDLSQTSNWTRHLFIDIIQYHMPQDEMHNAQLSWSYFVRPHQYLDISLALSYIPVLLGRGSPRFQKVNNPLVLEVPIYFLRKAFEISRGGEDFKNLGAFLFESIVLHAQDEKRQISESIYIFAFTFPAAVPSSSTFKRWFRKKFLTSWNYESERKDSKFRSLSECDVSSQEKKWRLENLGIIGHSSTTENHFVSLSCSSTSQNSVWFYDGLQKNGQAQCMPKKKAMSLSDSKIKMEGLFVISALNVLE